MAPYTTCLLPLKLHISFSVAHADMRNCIQFTVNVSGSGFGSGIGVGVGAGLGVGFIGAGAVTFTVRL